MIGIVGVFVVGIGLGYLLLTVVLGVLVSREQPTVEPPADGPGDAPPTSVYFLIAALDEALVIADTVRSALGQGDAHVVVVDDGSADDTGAAARGVDPQRVTVVRRELPEARLGKGAALNVGLERIVELVAESGTDPASVVVCVMDADGRLSDGALGHVLPLFADPRVGGAQLIVRIRNRERLLGLIQDVEFYGMTATSQIGRTRTGTVSLGGNGQFTRLTALTDLGRPPWTASLTEDLDLTISLLTAGWVLTSTPRAHVTQQGVERLRPLLRQRTRWYQGHMTCGGRLPEIWRSVPMSNGAVLELTAYLAVPWVLVLPWSVLFHVGLWQTYQAIEVQGWSAFGGSALGQGVGVVLWYLLIFFPSIVSGFVYFRRARGRTLVRSLVLAHLLIPAAYVSYAAAWLALARMMRGQTGWVKTQRSQEVGAPATAGHHLATPTTKENP
ncbi:MAG: glycosyltransferase family 2 protein [Actinobacteria bacterium]|nr:glycosyltransferase family 2 protein [Actinomycetota bacterium]